MRIIMTFVLAIAGIMAKAQAPEQVALQLFHHFNNHDWEKMVKLYAPEAILQDPSYEDGVKYGTDGLIEKYEALNKAFPDIHDQIINIFTSGNKVLVEFIATGTSIDGISLKLPICSILTVENGLIIKDATYYDN